MSAFAPKRLFHPVKEDRGPSVHRRIHVAEIPLVRGNLPAGMQIDLAQHQIELALRKIDINGRKNDRVKGQIPGCVPRILPFIGHGNVLDH